MRKRLTLKRRFPSKFWENQLDQNQRLANVMVRLRLNGNLIFVDGLQQTRLFHA